MLNNFLDFDSGDIISVLCGFFLALYGEPIYCSIRNKMDGKSRKIKYPTVKQVGGVIVAIGLLWTLWSTDNIQREIQSNSHQTLMIAEAACEEQKLATEERQALQDLFLGALSIPPNIRNLAQDDPVRIQWGKDLVNKYLQTFQHTNSERQRLAKEFAENPPSKPRCGNNVFSGQ